MQFSNYLINLLTAFVESYKNYYRRTFSTILVYTVCCFVAIALLLRFSHFSPGYEKQQLSLLSYFFVRYSANDTYSLVDCAKSVFLFFVALYAVGLSRQAKAVSESDKEIPTVSLTGQLQLKDIQLLSVILITCALSDYCLFRLDSFLGNVHYSQAATKWILSMLFLLRIYIPLLLFSLAINKLISNSQVRVTIRRLGLLFISFWLFNEFAYEISIFVRSHILGLMLIPFEGDNKYLFESFLGIPLVTFYFPGYYAAMTTPLKLTEEK